MQTMTPSTLVPSMDGMTPLACADPVSVVPSGKDGRQADATRAGSVPDAIRDSKILILDDEPYNVMVVRKYLRDAGYKNLLTLTQSCEALKTIEREQPSLLISDIVMPLVSGLEILRGVKDDERTAHLPVLILTASTDAETKRTALELGATDFLPKPVDPNDLAPRVRNALANKNYQDRLANHAEELEQEVCKRTAELSASREEVIHCLARATDYRDDNTGYHAVRVGRYAGIIAHELGFSKPDAESLELAAKLHDVGKIGVPDAILNTPGKLDPEQFAVMQRHCSFARKILTPLGEPEWRTLQTHSQLGASLLQISSSPLLMLAARIAQTHHEWWNGTGYPLGLAGEDIPLEGRITTVADVFDALSTPRPYKAPIPREKCFTIMSEERGMRFDPRVLDAFFARSEEVIQVQIEYMDRQ